MPYLQGNQYATALSLCKQGSYGLAHRLLYKGRAREIGGQMPESRPIKQKRYKMLHYALIFFLVAIVAAVLGFGGVAAASAGVAKILFFLFLVIFLVTLVMGVARRA